MDKTQLYILRTLTNLVLDLKMKGKVKGNFISEPDLFFLENHRRPDVCWLTDAQIDRLTYNNGEVPDFIIEVVSTNDQMNKVHKKMRNYEKAGVKIVWHIFPLLDEVHIYGGDHLDSMTVCRDEKICSAAPVLPDFAISVRDLLKKPAPPTVEELKN